ncbi:sugar ABC transporter permease [Gordonia jinhuaensis]|uniref:ABC transporter permease n=1 Tax=Gordonia jinhuaensis TaxID=1517702 RepID=A0A916WVA8_9ACTN|nr:sugar ABC transporter permease [Gordonia jinhuaensis]GGB36817.1 ABC transporter permease [Gordonia jinhuaensis]
MFVTLDEGPATGTCETDDTPGVFADTVSAATAAPRGRAGARSLMRRLRRIPLAPYLYVLPAVALLVAWTYRPLVQTFQLSFFDWNLVPTQPMTFVGGHNYQRVVTDPDLRQAVINTIIYIVAFMLFSLVLPVIIALAARRVQGRARTVYQALIFLPFLVTPVAASAVWQWLLAPDSGAITVALNAIGIHIGDVLRDPNTALLAIVVIVGWQMLGFGVLVVSAGIAGINPDYASAASMDGASRLRITRRITLPLLSPTLVFLLLMTILLAAQWTFPMIDVLTQGGPGNSTTNIYYMLYQIGFRNFDAGLAGAAGVLFFLVFGLIAIGLVKLADRLSFYDN